jgi:tRNA(His) 5'-end guanylyltransferase
MNSSSSFRPQNTGATQQAAICLQRFQSRALVNQAALDTMSGRSLQDQNNLLFRQLGIRRRPRATWMKAGIVVTGTGALTEVE